MSVCNTIIYSCLCGSLQESVQEGNGGNDIKFRQCSIVAAIITTQSLGNLVRTYFFKVYKNQVGLSFRFDPPTLGLGN